MTIEEAISAHLAADAGVSSLVGNRVYPAVAPQKPEVPYIVYTRISSAREHSHDGASGLARPRFQFDCASRSYIGAMELSNAVRLALDAFQGTMGGSGGVDVHAVFIEDEQDSYDDELKLYWRSLDFIIWHTE